MEKSIQIYHPVPSVRKYDFTAPNLAPAPRNPRDNDAVKVAPIMERGGHPMPRPCYFITDQLLSLWPPIRRFSPPPPGGERWNGGNLRHLSRKISGQHARMHRVIWNVVEGRRPLIKGYFAALRLIGGAVMSSACRCGS
ncbi:MAG: hypothetical protein CR217_15095 [Beijerinckiaceae bacterium]|nr:MAG: hypothetical protein CR217_15095 [Beijerinckiaceae bacterium]